MSKRRKLKPRREPRRRLPFWSKRLDHWEDPSRPPPKENTGWKLEDVVRITR